MIELSHETLVLTTRHPFTIARGTQSEYRTVRVVVRADGHEGHGEAAPNRFYGESTESVIAALDRFAPLLAEVDPWAIDRAERVMNAALRFNGSVKSAVSAALHDLAGKRLGVPVYRLWGLDLATLPQSSFTIAIAADAAELQRRVEEAAAYPVLKIKLGTDHDEQIVEQVRRLAPDKVLRVDANAAWTPKHALRMIDVLVEHRVEFVEQPVAAHDIDGMRFVRERSALPVIADESCVTSADIPRLVGAVDGINLKLSKCGGLREALRMIAVARTHGMLVMAGCMVESSLGITAAAHLAPLLDYVDLDGAALLANDPFAGATIEGGVLKIPGGAGLGVTRRE
ncbi:MAG: dipeptide epimerase [Gemmatimonadaceae bacterium]|nr:dipeptide epimerase [Gemmatimonadaceae bacterium]